MTDIPAGWYDDPNDPGFENYWDGTRYTASRPKQAAPPVGPTGWPQAPGWSTPPGAAMTPSPAPTPGRSKRPVVLAGVVVVSLLVAGLVAWAVTRSDPYRDAAEATFRADRAEALDSCAQILDNAASGEDLLRQFEDQWGDRAEITGLVRETDGIPEVASSWGWNEASEFIKATYDVCDEHRAEVEEWRASTPSPEDRSSCETELATVKTAIAAAEVTFEMGEDAEPGEFLADPSANEHYTWTEVGPGDWEPEPIGDPPC